jgi:hypothetical protein
VVLRIQFSNPKKKINIHIIVRHYSLIKGTK